jgi:hypothetical protein
MPEQKQITVDQHWAPRSYYKRFSDVSYNLQVFDKTKWTIDRWKSYTQVSNEDFFYGMRTGVQDEISQRIETAFDKFEGRFFKLYDKIVNNIYETREIEDEYLRELAFFMSMLWVRSNLFRKITLDASVEFEQEFIARTAQDPIFINQIFEEAEDKQGVQISESERQDFIDTMVNKKYTINPTNEAHLQSFDDIELYASYFYEKKWRIYTAGTAQNFFTSDVPVVEIPSEDTSFWGNPIWKRTHYFPLTPKILIELSDPNGFGKKVKRKCLKTDAEILAYNLKIIGYSHEKIYTSDVKQFEYIKANYKPA